MCVCRRAQRLHVFLLVIGRLGRLPRCGARWSPRAGPHELPPEPEPMTATSTATGASAEPTVPAKHRAEAGRLTWMALRGYTAVRGETALLVVLVGGFIARWVTAD